MRTTRTIHFGPFLFFTIKGDTKKKEAFLFGKLKIAEKCFNPEIVYACLFNRKLCLRKETLCPYDALYAQRFTNKSGEYLQRMVMAQYKRHMGKDLHIDDPRTFNEKLNWMKIFYHNPLMTVCADKARAKEYVIEKIGDIGEHFVELYGIFSSVEEIDFDRLPRAFVLKSNWGSGSHILVRDKNAIDRESVKETLRNWLKPESNHYYCAFEYGYKNIVPKIVCEKFLDYRYKIEFFCFDGKPVYYWIVYNDKTPEVCANFYAMDGKKLPLSHKYPNIPFETEQPECFADLVSVSKRLSRGFPFIRVDFYKTDASWFFCELTFVHWAGLMPFSPGSFDEEFGSHLVLPAPVAEDHHATDGINRNPHQNDHRKTP